MIVGLTGPSGAGKGVAAAEFAAHGFRVIDADLVARQVTVAGEPVLARLAEEFGADVLHPDGTLNRRRLAERAFATQEGTGRLNALLHGEICRRMLAEAATAAAEGKPCLFDAPLLFEAGLDKECDCCVAVLAPTEIRLARLRQRDRRTDTELRQRLARQPDDAFYEARCDYRLVNDGSEEDFRQSVEQVIGQIMRRGQK